MSGQSKIEWTDSTWNVITGCTLVSEGCRNCYAAELAATRLKHHWSRKGLAKRNAAGVASFTGEVRFNEYWLDQPLRWSKSRMIFVCANGDLFHEDVPDAWIDRVFGVMSKATHHTFQVLTKRPERLRRYWIGKVEVPPANIWLGTSIEDQSTADERLEELTALHASCLFASAEPLLGPIQISDEHMAGLNWVIVGGESGRNARPLHPDWARSIRDQCNAAGVSFFFKQWGEWLPWEPSSAPLWRSQNGKARDRHILFPSDFDNDPYWDDGLCYLPDCGHAAFQNVGKKAAGRTLDGQVWEQLPSAPMELAS